MNDCSEDGAQAMLRAWPPRLRPPPAPVRLGHVQRTLPRAAAGAARLLPLERKPVSYTHLRAHET